jgi:putative transposase
MMQTLMVKVETTLEQANVLHKTMHQFNAACNDIAETAFQMHLANKIELQKTVYYPIRERYNLSAQMAVRAISKTVEAYKRDKSIKPAFDLNGAMPYDQRILSWKGLDRVSLLTLDGRLILPIRICKYQAPKMIQPRGQVDLLFKDNAFYLAVVVDAPKEPLLNPIDVLGIDLGIKNIAVDSTGECFSGDAIEKTRIKLGILEGDLQSCGTPNAKRHLKKIGKREARFRRDTNHCISKKMVAKAKDTSSMIALEDLKGIGKNTTVRRSERRKHLSWGFDQLRQFIGYKAAIDGVPVAYIDPAYTSQECSSCHHISKSNRPTRDDFVCSCCGFSLPADYNAALNIRARVAVNMPIAARLFAEPQAHEFIPG